MNRVFFTFLAIAAFVMGVMVLAHQIKISGNLNNSVSKIYGNFAVCFSGSLRTFKQCFQSQHQFVLSRFVDPPDIYLVFGDDEDERDVQHACEIYQPKKIIIAAKFDSASLTSYSQKALFGMYNKCLLSHQLACDAGREYDGVLRLRYDLLFWNDIPKAFFQVDHMMHMQYEGCVSTLLYSRFVGELTDQIWCGSVDNVTSFLTNAVKICDDPLFSTKYTFVPMERVVLHALGDTIPWTRHTKCNFAILRTTNVFQLTQLKWTRKLNMLKSASEVSQAAFRIRVDALVREVASKK